MIRKITDEMTPFVHCARDSEQETTARALGRRYDACVIGSGPGGSVAAATLALSGLKVALVERGPFLPVSSNNFRVLDQSNRMGHLELTNGYRTVLYQGNGLGGGSLIYGAVAMKPKDSVFDDWKQISGVDSIDLKSLEPHFDHIRKVMSITSQEKVAENSGNRIVREMATHLGRPSGLEIVGRYTQGCAGVGMCSLGCGFDLKGTMGNSFLPLALASGNLEIFTECEAQALQGEASGGQFRATGLGVVVRDFSSGRVTFRGVLSARHYILAAAAFFSSGLLKRTRALGTNARIGAKVYLQPHAQIFALFDKPITQRGVLKDGEYIPSNGVPAIYNFNGFLEDHRFFWLASILFPANLASFVSHLPPSEHFEIMRRFHETMSITLTLRDDPLRSRVVIKDGRPQLDYRESPADVENLRMCFIQAARGFLAVGAKRVFLPLLQPPRIERESDIRQIEKLRFGFDDVVLYSDHTSGGNAYGASPDRGVTDEWGRVFGSENVFVADSSLFPSASGTNPSWTIMSLAHRVAEHLAAV